MKKIFYTFLAALLTTACVEPLQPYLGPITNEPTDAATMTLQFSIPVSPATKGEMTDQPNITSSSTVHVFVYNAASGALLQVSPATLKGTVTANTPWGTAESAITNHADFVVEVAMGSAHRYLQVVVDAPTYSTEGSTNDNETGIGYADNPIYLGDSESDVASKLYTKDKKTAYWQRVDLPNGLQAYTYPGGQPEKGTEGIDWTSYNASGTPTDLTDDWYLDKDGDTVNYGDFVNGTGQKITDGTGYVMSTDVANRVKYIPLVRNFVKISVSKAADGTFTPEKAVLINVPAAGYIAPYSSASGFVPYYLKDKYLTEQDKTLSDLPTDGTAGIASTGYTAPVPNDEFITACPDDDDCVEATNGIIPLYMYERGVATSKPTQLLVFGRFDGSSTDCWLKIDITDTDGHYIAFYRDLTYEMEIGAITGTSGYGTMQKAYEMPSIGNPSSSEETQTLTQVSDGKGTMIWVDFIDYASFKKEANEVRLRYKFVSFDGSKTSADAELSVTHSTATGAVTSTNLSGSPYNGTDTQDEDDDWYYVNVPLAAQGSTIMRSVVRVSGTATNSVGKTITLYRDVTFSVMPTQTMEVSMSPLTSDTANQPTTATITLHDGLGYSLFPLVIRIEAFNGSITPTDSDLPVGQGTSTFSTLDEDYAGNSAYYDDYHRTSGYYWYEKTISYDEYHSGTRVYTANFKTIYDSGNETIVAFSDPDGHFHTEVAPLRGTPTFKLASDNTSVNVKASEISASFDILSNVGTWTVTADNGAEVVSTRANTVSGSGNATITVSFPDNMNGSTTKEYHVTATLDAESQALVENYHDLVFTIYQAVTVTQTKEFTIANQTNLTVTDDDHTGATVTLTRQNFSYNNDGYFYNGTSTPRTMTFTPADGITITGITMSWSQGTGRYSDYYYSPSSISTPSGYSNFTVNTDDATWSGSYSGSSGLTATFNCRGTNTGANSGSRRTQVNAISITYTYQKYE